MTDIAWLGLRAASFVLLLQAAGAALFVAAFGSRLARSAAVIRRTGRSAATAALAVLALQYLFEPVHLAGEWSGISDASLHRLVLHSAAAAALAVRAAGIAAVASGLKRHGLAASAAGTVGSLAVLGSFLLTGHPAIDAHRQLLAPLLFLHVLVVAFWFGALVPLRQLCALEPCEAAARVIGAFSRTALWLVPLIALAGAGIAALLLPDVAALLAPYGLLLMGKVVLFALLLTLAALNRLRLGPALAGGERGAVDRFRRSVAAEYILICLVLALTAVLTGFLSPVQGSAATTAGVASAAPA